MFGWVDVGHFIHFTKPLEGCESGFELRSRFWLGEIELSSSRDEDETSAFERESREGTDGFFSGLFKDLASRISLILPWVFRAVANNRLTRFVAVRVQEDRSPLELAVANWRHATEEFGVLASFLQSAFEEREMGLLLNELSH